MNKKFKKSQIMMLSLLASLLIITPLMSSSLRPTYLINILIIALALEAGLLSAFSKPPPPQDNNKTPQQASAEARVISSVSASPPPPPPNSSESKNKAKAAVEKSASEKLPKPAKVVMRVRKCPSTPSLFFIGSGETEAAADDHHQAFGEELYEEEEEEIVEGLSGQELFTKAEMFIGNFYNQLKMQREESWKRIHGFYQKAF